MPITPNDQAEIRRVILLRGENPEVLVVFDGAHHTLPEVEIPRWQRVAEHLTAALFATRGIDAVSLSSLDDSPSKFGSGQTCYEIMESHGHVEPRDEEKWMAVDCLREGDFRDPRDFRAVRKGTAQSIACAENTLCGPFGRLGWFSDLQRWVQKEIQTQGLHLSGRYRQLNASPTFSLIRFETDGPAVWFKAVGPPNEREYALTLALARSLSRFLPKVIAKRPELNGWLSLEAPGNLLSECSTLASWEVTAADLAELQLCSLDRNLHLLDHGARDLRTARLANLVEPFFQTMGEIMERQTKTSPVALSRKELRCLTTRVGDALAVLDETGVPTTLGHLDLNPGNIVCSSTGCVFLDCAEIFVGHPFLSFEFLREHFRRAFGQDHPQESSFAASYTFPWRAFVSEGGLRRVLEFTPLVAVFACAVGNDRWTDPRTLQEPRAAGYLRSLTRRMDREARALVERSLSCTN
jgi:hypothetical protein